MPITLSSWGANVVAVLQPSYEPDQRVYGRIPSDLVSLGVQMSCGNGSFFFLNCKLFKSNGKIGRNKHFAGLREAIAAIELGSCVLRKA